MEIFRVCRAFFYHRGHRDHREVSLTSNLFLILFFISLSSCSWKPSSEEYRNFYSYADDSVSYVEPMQESDFFLVILVDARHLDYSSGAKILPTIAKHPRDCSKNGDVGHAWIYLQGKIDGKECYVEGGHSGELGIVQPKYFDGIMNYLDFGYADPTEAEMCCPRYEPNPVKYLWATQHDGFFQWGNGGHSPSFAIKVDLTEQQFKKIVEFIDSQNYCYRDYAITGNQCSNFVARVAFLAGLELEYLVTMPIERQVQFGGRRFILWHDECYSEITFSSPDILERSMMFALREGKAESALEWYQRKKGQ